MEAKVICEHLFKCYNIQLLKMKFSQPKNYTAAQKHSLPVTANLTSIFLQKTEKFILVLADCNSNMYVQGTFRNNSHYYPTKINFLGAQVGFWFHQVWLKGGDTAACSDVAGLVLFIALFLPHHQARGVYSGLSHLKPCQQLVWQRESGNNPKWVTENWSALTL